MDGNLPEVDFTDGSPLIPEEALAALVVGVERGDHLVNLELLGLGQRTINLLEERGVTTIKALLHKTKEELLSFENFGKTTCLLSSFSIPLIEGKRRGS